MRPTVDYDNSICNETVLGKNVQERFEIIIVLGMHRSGTSTITRALKTLNVDLGEKLMEASPYNQKGYWEDIDFHNLNMKALDALGVDTHDTTMIREDDFNIPAFLPLLISASELIKVKVGSKQPFAFKDPRTCILLPFWQQAFQQLGIKTKYIIVSRNPLSVAASLRDRNKFDLSKSYLHWLQHMISAVYFTKNSERVFVSYENMIKDPILQLYRMADKFKLKQCLNKTELNDFCHTFLNKELCHNSYALEDLVDDSNTPNEIIKSYEFLTNLADDKLSEYSRDFNNFFNELYTQLIISRDTLPKGFIDSAGKSHIEMSIKRPLSLQIVKSNTNHCLAIFTPNIGTLSETFIKRQIQLLAPGQTVVVSANIYDRTWLNAPLLEIPSSEGPARYAPEVEAKVVLFLHSHKVTHILCEYGCYGTEIVELNDRLLHIPLFVHFHGADASAMLRNQTMVNYYRWMGQRVNGIIAVARPMANRLTAIGIPAEKISIAHYGIEIPEHTFATPTLQPCTFLAVMRLVPKKGPLYLLKAFAKALEKEPTILLDIIGDGFVASNTGQMRQAVVDFIRENNLSNSVLMHGAKPSKYVMAMMGIARVFVQHSITDPESGDAEGLPNSILEASGAGLPIISTRHEGIPEEVEHGVTGLLVDECDIDGMAECMVHLARNPELRKVMGVAAREKIMREFNVIDTIQNLRNIIGLPGISSKLEHKCTSPVESSIDDKSYITKPIDYSKGLVRRTPDYDARVKHPYRPMSIVADLIKGSSAPQQPTTITSLNFRPTVNIMQANSESMKPLSPVEPKTFMQIHTFYQAYLDSFYSNHPDYKILSFIEQINLLVRDGFSANHMMAPYMNQLGYEAHLVVANNPYSQSCWLNEHGMTVTDKENWILEVARRQVDAINPDVLYLSDPITFDSRFVRTLAKRPKLVLGWRAANIPPETDWSEFDVLLSCLTGLREVAEMLGAKATEHFFPGFPVWMNTMTKETQPVSDVVFSGSWTDKQHETRGQLLAAIAEDAKNSYTYTFYLNGQTQGINPEIARNNLGGRFGVDMYKALRSGRIVLDARASHIFHDRVHNRQIDMGRNETANMRIFEATGSGCFLLTEYFDNLNDFFEVGSEIETFRNATELKGKIHYYLANPDKREAIARRGQERCLRDYSMEKRAVEFDAIIRKHLNKPDTRTDLVSELKLQAEHALTENRVQDAFNIIIKAKALKKPLQSLDLLRAQCFLKMNIPDAAIQALLEETRFFPDNLEARKLLDSLQSTTAVNPGSTANDSEFQMILSKIRPFTMLGEARLYNLYSLAKFVCENNIPGNFVECGVAAGGSSALLAYVIKKYSFQPRRLFSFDSFSGMPRPTDNDSHQGIDAESTGWGTGTCSAPEESVIDLCRKLGVEDVLTTIKGYFEETLPKMRDWVGMVALLHMDGDWYESTKAILDNLYDRLVNCAYVQVDDYGYWDGCRKAIHEFANARSLQFAITQIDGTGVWFIKPDTFKINQMVPQSLFDDFIQDDPVPQGIVSQMSANERFQLYYAVRKLLPVRPLPVSFIEIGSYSGASLMLICQALRRHGIPYQGISVEPGGTSQFHEVIKTLKQNVIHLPLFSHEASLRLGTMFSTDNLPEFIFVDGDHSYQGVKQDIIDYYQLLAPGGIMVFHDYLPPLDDQNRDFIYFHHANSEPGIRQACHEVMELGYGLKPLEIPLLYPDDPTQTQPHLPIIPMVNSTICAYRKPN